MFLRTAAKPLFVSAALLLVTLSLHGEDKAAPATELTTAAAEKEATEGFVPLFNGKDMTGWVGNTKGYYADGKGNIVCDPKKEGGNVYTEKEYDNFVLRFQFKLTPGANNGLGIRAPLEGDAAYVGMELQILDDTSEKYKGIQPWQRHGSIYGIAAAKPGFLNPVGEWNSEEVIADGRHIAVKLNGVTIVDVENLDTVKTAHSREMHPGLKNVKGHIGFLGHGDPLQFRSIRIKELVASKPAAAAK
jgi:hypothetical protein